MVLTISSWFNEPGVKFNVSHKIYKRIRQLLIEEIMHPFELDKKDSDTFIGLITATSLNTEALEVRGPELNKKNKTINYGLWLPYRKITESDDYLRDFLQNYFDALVKVFQHYDVPEANVRKVQKQTESEVLNNSDYQSDISNASR
jgi:hypothetical protein